MSRIRDIANILTAANNLSTDTETAAAILSAVPSQSGNSGKYLTTNGSLTSWGTITQPSEATISTRGTVYGSTGAYKTVLGFEALGSGNFNGAFSTVVLGYQAGYHLSSGEKNIIIGGFASQNNSSGSFNTVLGTESARFLSGGSNNVFLGYQSGLSLSSGSNNILVGSNAQASTSTTSNQITLGDASITSFRIPGLGIDFNKNIEIMNIMGAY
jgi:hypothetical protein